MSWPDWQPIETAPRDGSSVLLLWPGGRRSAGWWSEMMGAWADEPYETYMLLPLAWMPLPNDSEEELQYWEKRAQIAEPARPVEEEKRGPMTVFIWQHLPGIGVVVVAPNAGAARQMALENGVVIDPEALPVALSTDSTEARIFLFPPAMRLRQ